MLASATMYMKDIRILLVDDHEDGREALAMYLEHHGARVVRARSGNEALALARAEPVSVLLSNIMMPGASGVDLVRALRADPMVGALPAIAITGFAPARMRTEALSSGFDRFFQKPVDLPELIRAVGELAGAPLPSP